ncbi:MAG: peptidylprolyl isomerase [Candidatus Aminicenantes bacterium]|nr:peptidylprolyl isomerase [Candidatus Aminicenantes bacterium]
MTQTVKTGDTVKVHYTGRFDDGEVFDSSEGREPLQFKVGTEEIIKGLEKAVLGMKPGERKSVTVNPEEGYGNYNKKLLMEMPKERIPEDISPEKGMPLQLVNRQGKAIPVVVAEILDKSIRLDANHPLAGKLLYFDLELVEIV